MKTQLFLSTTILLALTLGAASCKPGPGEGEDSAGDDSAAQATDITHVDVIAASQLLSKDTAVVVLDVRTPAEYAEGHLPGKVVNVDFKAADFKDAAAKLDRSTPYLVHCHSGGRSAASLDVLKELGFEKLYHLDGGMSAWKEAGEVVEK